MKCDFTLQNYPASMLFFLFDLGYVYIHNLRSHLMLIQDPTPA